MSTPAARRRVAWHILQNTGKSTDGWFSRTLNRPISRAVSYVLLTLRLTANHASVLVLLLGLAVALIAAQPGYLALATVGVLFHLASVLDGVDGEMARATLTESEIGARLGRLVTAARAVDCAPAS